MSNNPVSPRQPALVLQVLWAVLLGIIAGIMLLSALAGVTCLILGLVSLGADLSGVLKLYLGGAEVRTAAQKLFFAALGAVMTVAGIAFFWSSGRERVGRALMVFAALVGLFAAISWLAGSSNILSVGG
jgi:hypothetical protein